MIRNATWIEPKQYFFFIDDTATTDIYTLSLHDALPISIDRKYVHVLFTETQGGTELGFQLDEARSELTGADWERGERSEEHTSELQSQSNLVCRLLLEKKKIPLVMK